MKRLVNNLTFRVLVAIAIGVVLGVVAPSTAKSMRPLGDTFVNLVKMVIAPIVFFTIVLGIATLGDLKRVGRVGGKALVYFEVVTTFALAIGLIIASPQPKNGTRNSSRLITQTWGGRNTWNASVSHAD